MPAKALDVLVIGAGHNGLVTAAYLARAGKSVLVLERAPRTGGTVATEEFAPGFLAPVAFPTAELFAPQIAEELELERHGLRLMDGRAATFMPLPDGKSFLADSRGCTPALGERDIAGLRALEAFTATVSQAIEPILTRPLTPLEPDGIAELYELVKMGLTVARVGTKAIPEILRFLPMCVKDVLDEHLEHAALKAALAAPAVAGSWLAPRAAGSAYNLLHHRPSWVNGLIPSPRYVRGGPSGLTDAIGADARAHGADIRTGAAVRRIAVRNGRASGVVLEDGEELEARVVVSALDPRTTLLGLVGPDWLDPEVAEDLRGLRCRGSVALIQLGLDRVPQFEGAPAGDSHLSGRIQIGPDLDYIERAFDDAKYARPPRSPLLEITIPSLVDGSLAPGGKHVMTVWVQYAARELRDTSWEVEREVLGKTVVATIARHAPGFADTVLHHTVQTPLDIERRFGLSGGCLYHAEPALDQMLYMRPIPGWYRHRTPIDGLYLCGAGTHPGGGVTGLPGRNAARRVLTELP